MFRGGKDRHIQADFRDERNSCHWRGRETGDGTNQLQLVWIRLCEPKDFGLYMISVFVELVDVLQALFELCSLFTGYRPVNGSLYLFNGVLTAPVKKRSHIELFAGMLQNVLDDGTRRLSEHVRKHIIQFQVRNSETVLSTIFLADKHIS